MHGSGSLIAALIIAFQTITCAQQTWEWDAGGLRDVRLKTVKFRVFLSSEVTRIRGALVLIPGTHGDGRRLTNDPEWRNLAKKHHFAILGCQFSDGDIAKYQDDKKFVVCRSIEDALRKIASLSGHPEMAKAPLAFWGMSAGSNLSARYCRFNPRRVIAFASTKGTRGPTRDKQGTEDIPMLFSVGAKANPVWVENSLRNIKSGLTKGAPWTLALHPNEGHVPGRSLKLSRIYLDSVIPLRLGAGGRLNRMRTDKGWLGDPETLECLPYRDYKGKPKQASWLPDEKTALAWKEYLSI